MKRPMLRPSPDKFTFERADAISSFCTYERPTMRASTALAWYRDIPDAGTARSGEGGRGGLCRLHLHRRVLLQDKLTSWMSSTKPIPDKPRKVTDRRDATGRRCRASADPPRPPHGGGGRSVRQARHHADNDIESAKDSFIAKRAAFRNLIQDLPTRRAAAWSACRRICTPSSRSTRTARRVRRRTALGGLEVIITELDVDDQKLSGDPAQRDAIGEAGHATLYSRHRERAALTRCRPGASRIAIAGSTGRSPGPDKRRAWWTMQVLPPAAQPSQSLGR